jgi:hypothetical protein
VDHADRQDVAWRRLLLAAAAPEWVWLRWAVLLRPVTFIIMLIIRVA